MKTYYYTALALGLVLAGFILYLVRRDHIYIRQGMFWIAIALATLAFALWPGLIDVAGRALGIAYPPTLLLLVAIVVLVVKALLADIALTKTSRDVRRLNQRIALIEAEHPSEARPAAPPLHAANELPADAEKEKARRSGP